MSNKVCRIRFETLSILLFFMGILALIISIVYTSSVLAFIGLGMMFWGAILTYIRKSDYVPTVILDASVSSLAEALDQIMQAFDCRGNAVYLPPKYFENPEDTRVFISKQKGGSLPAPEQILENSSTILRKPDGLILTPPGAELTKLFEKTLGTSFTTVDLEYLKKHMPKLLIEDLEIATSLEIQTDTSRAPESAGDTSPSFESKQGQILVKITTTVYQNSSKQTMQYLNIPALGSPLTSAIACAIAKATGKLTAIEKQETSKDGTTIEVEYHLLKEEHTKE